MEVRSLKEVIIKLLLTKYLWFEKERLKLLADKVKTALINDLHIY